MGSCFYSVLLLLVGLTILCSGEMAMGGKGGEEEVVEVKVGVVLDLNFLKTKMDLVCIRMALSDFYDSRNGSSYKTRLVLYTVDSKADVALAAFSVVYLINNVGVQAIIGPSTSTEATFVANIANKTHVPVISYSATSPTLSSTKNPFFVQANQNDASQVAAISALILNFGWKQVVPIYVDDEYGSGLIPFLIDALQEVDARVPYRCVIPPLATDDQILMELYKLMTKQTRVFIVHMAPALGSRLFLKAKEVGMMSADYVWITANGLTNLFTLMEPSVARTSSMQGVLGVRTYYPRTQELVNFTDRWRREFRKENPDESLDAQLNILGLWAYDATVALAKATEKVGAASYNHVKPNTTSGNLTDAETLQVSPVGYKLKEAMLRTSFQGLSGDFRLANGQLPSPTFEIINVIRNGPRGVGFWTQDGGLRRGLDSNEKHPSDPTASKLGEIIWPGMLKSTPKGWVIPTSEKKFRIGVPNKTGFTEFVKVTIDSRNRSDVSGYSIELFKTVVQSLGYFVPYEFIPFDGTYDALVQQVYHQKFNAVVGDITILAKRSKYVDFTLPYIESGVSMVVPLKDSRGKNAWVFLKPLTWELWFTSFCFFIFIGLVIWILEHRINEDFRGPSSHQAGVIFWFSFSTMVFAHREKVVGNLARFVVIMWVFVVLILTQSYTASLTSMLTVQQLQPTIIDINDLRKSGDFVGYQNGSFVEGFLKQMKFSETKLRPYSTVEELDEALSKGSAKGGIAAAFDELPFIRLLLEKYCSKYAMVPPTYKADGFGFVFPRGSPLVSDVSRAVLRVTEEDKKPKIEAALSNQPSCPDAAASVSSTSLDLNSFWGLFLIVGAASAFSLLIFASTFLYRNRDVFGHPQNSLSSVAATLAQRFLDKDLESHAFQKTATGPPATPLSFLDRPDFSPFREQGTSTSDLGIPHSRDDEDGDMPSARTLTDDPTRTQSVFPTDVHDYP